MSSIWLAESIFACKNFFLHFCHPCSFSCCFWENIQNLTLFSALFWKVCCKRIQILDFFIFCQNFWKKNSSATKWAFCWKLAFLSVCAYNLEKKSSIFFQILILYSSDFSKIPFWRSDFHSFKGGFWRMNTQKSSFSKIERPPLCYLKLLKFYFFFNFCSTILIFLQNNFSSKKSSARVCVNLTFNFLHFCPTILFSMSRIEQWVHWIHWRLRCTIMHDSILAYDNLPNFDHLRLINTE